MLIYLIRHGQTDWNCRRLFQGELDIPLNDQGLAQAEGIGRRFQGVPIDRIYHSPLSRAKDTAEALARYTGAPLTSTDGLHEICMGDWQGKDPFAQAEAENPQWARPVFRRTPPAPRGRRVLPRPAAPGARGAGRGSAGGLRNPWPSSPTAR